MISFYCSECVINWNPYQTDGGKCKACGSGTSRKQEPASDEADEMYKEVVAQEKSRHLHKMFEEFYVKREVDRLAEELEEFAK